MVDEEQRVHVTIHDPVTASQNCPSSYKWYRTGEPRVRVVQKVEESPSEESDFEALQPKEILYAASVNLKLEYIFYLLGKRFRALVTKQKKSCSDIRALGGWTWLIRTSKHNT